MRILSPRFHCLRQPPAPAVRQVRCISSSRYSNPAKRGFAAAPAQSPSFVDIVVESNERVENAATIRNPQIAHEEKQQYHLRRMRFAGMGLLFSIAGLALVMSSIDLDEMEQSAKKQQRHGQQLDASSEANEKFQGKEVHVIGAGEGKRIVAQGQGEEIELMETGTSSVPHFPRTIYLPASSGSQAVVGSAQPNAAQNPGNIDNQEEYTLVGLGIRTVMWIQVYVVGFYIRTRDISPLQEKLIHRVNPAASTLVPSEKEDLRQKLLDPVESREIWNELFKDSGLKTAWRVSPTRNTDFGHLRDGFVTGINKRTQEARQLSKGAETEYDAEDFGQSIQAFKGIFASGKAPKGSILIMARDQDGTMDMLYQPKPDGSRRQEMEKLGSIADERISRLIWLGYLGGDKVSSEAARKGVVEGCVGFAGRPVGSVETRVI